MLTIETMTMFFNIAQDAISKLSLTDAFWIRRNLWKCLYQDEMQTANRINDFLDYPTFNLKSFLFEKLFLCC